MTAGRSTADVATTRTTQPDDAGDLRASARPAASAEPALPAAPPAPGDAAPAFAMLGDPDAAACEGDSCAIP